jgi:integrase/recombinase XerC
MASHLWRSTKGKPILPLVYDSADLWLDTLRASGRKPATLSTYRYAVDQLRAWRGGHVTSATSNVATPLETTTRIEAMAFTRHLLDTYTPMGVRSRIKSLTNFFNWAVSEELCEANPFAKVRVSVPDEAMPILSDADLDRMLGSAKKHSRRDYAIIVMLADTGARKGEIANVRMEDVDLRSGMLRFHESKTRARSVPMSDRLVVAVGHWLRERGTCRETGLWLVSDPYSLVRACVRRHSGGTVSPHMFRRRFAVTWLLRGGSEVGLQRVAGWNSNTMVALYTKASSDVLATTEMRRLMS